MKKGIISLALLTFSFAGFAQKTFTKETFNELLDEYKTDSKAFFNNRLSTDFRYSDEEGKFLYRQDITSGDAQKISKTEILEPVIFQSGDLAVVSGIHKTERVEKDGNENSEVACTYTFERRKNKWMFVASQQTAIVKK